MSHDLDTILTYHEAQVVETAIKLAYAAELARLRMLAAQDGTAYVGTSGLYTQLSRAKTIMDRRRERAEEMGG